MNQDSRKKLPRIILVIAILTGILLFIALGYIYRWEFMGIVKYNYNNDGSIKGVSDVRTLWDWLSLIIVPGIITFGLWWLNHQQEEARLRSNNLEKELSTDRLNQVTLDNYFDKVGELILTGNNKVGDIISYRTLAILRIIDGYRKGLVIKFLYDAGLLLRKTETFMQINFESDPQFFTFFKMQQETIHILRADLTKINLGYGYFPFIELINVNLTDAYLSHTNLSQADLRLSNLTDADLRYSDLSNANLFRAYLVSTKLQGANLGHADLKETILTKATFDSKTVWPEGFNPSAAGAISST